MKGIKHINIDGKKIAFKFDLNALETFTDEVGIGLDGLEEALNKVSNIKLFIQCLSSSGGTELTSEQIGSMDFSVLNQVFELLKESMGNVATPQKVVSAK
jgi:hypothetical protein